MAGNYRGPGERLSVPANVITSAVSAGDLVDVGAVYGVAIDDGAANDANVLLLQGTYQLTKATGGGTGGAIGDKANATGANLITAGAGTYVGHFAATAGDNDTTALVTLLGFPA